jgi:hypothetical protein
MSTISIGVGLFVYNRPKHTRIVLESLKKNNIPKLYIFADGPKDGKFTPEINETRALINAVDWCPIEVIEQSSNLRTVGHVTFGLRHIFLFHEAAIVLEDDCEVRPDYFTFMQKCLQFYKDSEEIYHVNGYQLPITSNEQKNVAVYASPLAMSWGFGLWKRSWKRFRLDVDDANEYFQTKESRRLLDVVPDFAQRMQALREGRVNSFTYRWNFIINKEKALCVAPYKSFVRNIGWDGQGVNCKPSKRYDIPSADWQRPTSLDFNLPTTPSRDSYMDKKTRSYYRKKPDVLIRAYYGWRSLWRIK